MNFLLQIPATRIFLVCILLLSLTCQPATAADTTDSLAISNSSEESAENVTESAPTATETATVTGTATILPAETGSVDTPTPADPATTIPATEVPGVATTVPVTEVPFTSPTVNAAEPPAALPVQPAVMATLTQTMATVTAGESSGIPPLIRLPVRAEFRGIYAQDGPPVPRPLPFADGRHASFPAEFPRDFPGKFLNFFHGKISGITHYPSPLRQ